MSACEWDVELTAEVDDANVDVDVDGGGRLQARVPLL